ncbi:MAG: glycosyltransferase [Thermoleophilia bacterium]|nr:glycosyltransferase [Thermoleophilia bacterium]
MSVGDRVRVLVFTAPVGDGHVAAAQTLADDIRRRNTAADVEVVNALEAFNLPLRWLLLDAYRWQLTSAPWLFGIVFAGLRRSKVLRSMSRLLVSSLGSRSIRRAVRDHDPDVIVSTFPATTTILGCLKLRGQVNVPVCATITDFAGVEMWADRGVDLHLVMHESLVETIDRIAGAGSTRVVNPLVAAEFRAPAAIAESRRSLGFSSSGRLVVVSGGGWGVGDLDGAVRVALELPDMSVVCLAGRDEKHHARLLRAFDLEPRVTVLGFTHQMSKLLGAADGLIHSTGGVTCLEALARGCPIIAYGAPRGHAPALARKMADLGLLVHARSAAELRVALTSGRTGDCVVLDHPDAADLVLAARSRVTTRARARAARPLALAAAMTLLVLGIFSSDLTYPLVAEAFSLPEPTAVSQQGNAISFVVSGDRQALLGFAPLARSHRLHGSVVTSDLLSSRQIAVLRAAGLDPIPGIESGGIRSSLSERRTLQAQVHAYRVGKHFYFLAPREGFTITGYLLARHLGGIPLQSHAVLGQGHFTDLQAGVVVTADLHPGGAAAQALLRSWERLARTVPQISSVPPPQAST